MLCASLKVKSLIDSQASSMSFQLDGNFTRNFRGGTTSWSSTQKTSMKLLPRSLVKMSRSTPRNTQRLVKEPLSGPKVESRRLFNWCWSVILSPFLLRFVLVSNWNSNTEVRASVGLNIVNVDNIRDLASHFRLKFIPGVYFIGWRTT